MRTLLLASTAFATLATAMPAMAQDAEGETGGIGEIVVTAQRKEESLQDAAIAIDAVTGDSLIQAGVSQARDITKLVPALTIGNGGGVNASLFLRADGTFEHHSIFWVNCDLPIAPDHFKFMHIAFGCDDIDEVMLGANIMEAKGWKNASMNSSGGISRHRISSAIYYYCDMPGKAGEAEYHADTDYVDDNWIPRAWDFRFGSLLWSNNAPPIFRGDDIPMDMTFDADQVSFAAYRKASPGKLPVSGKLAEIAEADEHAL